MRLDNNDVVMSLDEFAINCLTLGIAVQLLNGKYGKTTEEWIGYLSEAADNQLKKLSQTQIEQMINVYVTASES